MESSVVVFILYFLVSGLRMPQALAKIDWWETASFYQIYTKSFQDSDGDGIGDLKGITSRLEYLKEIGATAALLSPIFESPMSIIDNGILNFTKIDPIYGSLADFDEMIAKAKMFDIKIILDFIPNHTSDKCEWFQKSINRETGYEDFYVWHDGILDENNPKIRYPPSNWISVYDGSQWKWHDQRQQFYLHQFQDIQPDLNYTNPLVHQAILDALEYWLDHGVDGFRLDTMPYIYEKRNEDGSFPNEPRNLWPPAPANSYAYHKHIYTTNQYENVELLYKWREFLEQYQLRKGGDSRVLMASAEINIYHLKQYFGNGTRWGTQLPMNFYLMYVYSFTTAEYLEEMSDIWMSTMWETYKTANWALGNANRNRVAETLGRKRVDMMNALAHTLPGAVLTYYGEEIGMINADIQCTQTLCDKRDRERSPMQWDATENAGFTNGSSTWLPLAEDYKMYNVANERKEPGSHLHFYKQLQNLKYTNAFKNFKATDGFGFKAIDKQIFQITRSIPDKEEYMILFNLGKQIAYADGLSSRIYECKLLSSQSTKRVGDKINLAERIYLNPYEVVVLHWLAL